MTSQHLAPQLAELSRIEQYVSSVATEQALQQLLHSPRLPEALRRLQAAAHAEAKKRRA